MLSMKQEQPVLKAFLENKHKYKLIYECLFKVNEQVVFKR